MELLPGIIAENTALYLEEAKTLIVADLHIGYEEERRRAGVLLPQEQKKYFKQEMERLCSLFPVRTIILAGDIKHEFGTISKEEWRDVQEFIKGIQEKDIAVRVVGGNHDVLIKPILQGMGIELKKSLEIQNGKLSPLIVHGDKTLDELISEGALSEDTMKQVSTIIIGHEHPALRITDGLRTETVKCFLVGESKLGKNKNNKKHLIVMPSWNPLAFGTDVIKERPLGPLLKRFSDFSAFAVMEGQVLAFGVVEQLQRLSLVNVRK